MWNDPIIVESQKDLAWHDYLLECNNSIVPVVRADFAGVTNILSTAFSSFDENWKTQYGVFETFPAAFSDGTIAKHKRGSGNLGMLSTVSVTPYGIGYLPLSLARANTINTLAWVVNKRGQVSCDRTSFVSLLC